MTALSSDPTGRYRRPLGGAGTGSPSSAASISSFSIPRSGFEEEQEVVEVGAAARDRSPAARKRRRAKELTGKVGNGRRRV